MEIVDHLERDSHGNQVRARWGKTKLSACRESRKHATFLLRCFKESEETQREMLPQSSSIYSEHCSYIGESVPLCCGTIMPDFKSQFQALRLVVAALASIFTVVFIPRIQSTAALSPECVPQCWHNCCHFPFAHFTKPDWGAAPGYSSFDFKWNHSSAICWPAQKHANFSFL